MEILHLKEGVCNVCDKYVLVRLSTSGHYPHAEKIILLTKEEWEEVLELTEHRKQYLYDSEEGRELIEEFRGRAPIIKPKTLVIHQ